MKYKIIALTMGICLCSLLTTAQTNYYDGWKDGNNQFRLTVKGLEVYFMKTTTIPQFEKTLGHYDPHIERRDTTRYENDSLAIYAYYVNMTPKQLKEGDFDDMHLSYDKKQRITSIRFIMEENDVNVDKLQRFLQQVNAAGYKNDLRATRMYDAFARNGRKVFYYNATKKVRISIYYIEENRYSIEFSK